MQGFALGDLLQENFVHVAPLPAFAGFEGADDRMLGLMEMLGGMGVLRRVAAADVAAYEAFPQVDPGITHLQAFLAALAAGSYFLYFFNVGAGGVYIGHSSPRGFR
jgi:hypothetical protein